MQQQIHAIINICNYKLVTDHTENAHNDTNILTIRSHPHDTNNFLQYARVHSLCHCNKTNWHGVVPL